MKHYNPNISKSMSDIFNLKGENTDEVNDEIVPIIPIQPRIDLVGSLTSTSSGILTLYTTPTNKDFYLTSAQISFSKNSACDMATGDISLKVTIEGKTVTLLQFAVITGTQERDSMFLAFPIPLKLDRGTSITLSGTYTAGVCSRSCGITGFLSDIIK